MSSELVDSPTRDGKVWSGLQRVEAKLWEPETCGRFPVRLVKGLSCQEKASEPHQRAEAALTGKRREQGEMDKRVKTGCAGPHASGPAKPGQESMPRFVLDDVTQRGPGSWRRRCLSPQGPSVGGCQEKG